jgi:hypothetical protein
MVTVTSPQSLWREIEGKRVVLMPLDDYEALIDQLEDLKDALELQHAIAQAGEFVPFDEMVAAIQAEADPQAEAQPCAGEGQ